MGPGFLRRFLAILFLSFSSKGKMKTTFLLVGDSEIRPFLGKKIRVEGAGRVRDCDGERMKGRY